MLKRISVFVYGVACYVLFLGTFLYAVGFVSGFLVPKSLDSEPEGPLGLALLVNAGLLLLFAAQHSIMARRWFKRAWTRIVPQPAERSTFVLFTCIALITMFMFWKPMGGVLWRVESPVEIAILYGLAAIGWMLVLYSTFLIDHFSLFGLSQVYLNLRGEQPAKVQFRTPAVYQWVRHPLYLGFLIAFWSTPVMTMAHFLFAVATTCYIGLAIQFEERDLVHEHGSAYVQYRRRVPMILPWRTPRQVTAAPGVQRAKPVSATFSGD
jgi:protein-S-isoprenylcysteine O-methyltransferase Ste14